MNRPFRSPTVRIILLTIAIFLFSKNPYTSFLSLHLTLALLLICIVLWYKKSLSAYPITALILSLVAATGWFFSPFFFTLYLLAVILAFLFPPATSLGFVATLVGLFSINIGEVDLAYDFLVVLSLLTVIPISLYLRREYLRLKETEKKILILEKEHEAFATKIEEVLANTVTNFATTLRQPISTIKQLSYHMEKVHSKVEGEAHRQQLVASVEEALQMINRFEEEVTGKKLLTTPKK